MEQRGYFTCVGDLASNLRHPETKQGRSVGRPRPRGPAKGLRRSSAGGISPLVQ